MGIKTGLSFLVIAAAVSVAAPVASAQGDNGFLRGKGQTDVAFTYVHEEYESFWVADHKVRDPAVGEVTRESMNLWIAHGLRDDLDLIVSGSYVDAEADGTGNFDDEHALQDAVLGAKWRFWDRRLGPGNLSVLATPAVKIPMTHYEANNVTAIGDGQVDLRFRGVIHYSFDCGAYVAVESGYDYRTDGTPNEMPFNVSFGATFFDRVTVSPFWSRVAAIGGDDIGQPGFSFPDVEEDYTRWGIGAYVRITEMFGATLGFSNTTAGTNTGDVNGYWLGLVGSF